MRRTRPLVGARGLESMIVPEGKIERGWLGRLRMRFSGHESDFEPENRVETRPLSFEEATWWNGLQKMVDAARPIADSQWNLVTMRIGPRVLSRLPLGSVVTFQPNGTPPFKGSFTPTVPEAQPASDVATRLAARREADLLRAIDSFLHEDDGLSHLESSATTGWDLAATVKRPGFRGASSPSIRSTKLGRSKWHKCPICRAPVVRGRFNPRIPFGSLRPGLGSIRDLRGGYLSRLRETYLVEDPDSILESAKFNEESAVELPRTDSAVRLRS